MTIRSALRTLKDLYLAPVRWWWDVPWYVKIVALPVLIVPLLPFIAAEQTFLYFLSQRLIADDRIYLDYIAELPKPYKTNKTINDCKKISIFIIYYYEICTLGGSHAASHTMFIKKPNGYIVFVEILREQVIITLLFYLSLMRMEISWSTGEISNGKECANCFW